MAGLAADHSLVRNVLQRCTACFALLLMGLLVQPAWAGGQTVLFDPRETIRQHFWKELYFAGGEALWCKTRFIDAGSRLAVEYIYQVSWIKDRVGCTTRAECDANREFLRMTSDLHNMYPAEKRVQLARRDAQFEKVLASDALPDPACIYKISGGYVEPNDEIKGDIARAMLYMREAYELPLPGALRMYVEWNNIDPPDATEKRRNDLIMKIQGNRNPFINNPKSANDLRTR